MKHLLLALSLFIIPVTVSAFIPPRAAVDIFMTTDTIYLQDKSGQTWKTRTDCSYNITDKSDVSIRPLDNSRITKNKRLLVKVDDEKQICRIIELTQAS